MTEFLLILTCIVGALVLYSVFRKLEKNKTEMENRRDQLIDDLVSENKELKYRLDAL